ncbi:uncharacterized protein FIBRA_09118 [Fibroporia radiculosa]|uniref:Uncharacterized protein n=1 Tax=Fibroporia radiculosa TaxID=599839 RepID=J4ICQ4_9APHY|nr:uncharacterized protein FIBRA_09118 [Fibroporia radiculosa]CCM06816.1 predicted protein [Fibroporia radiculosa]
MPRHQNILWKIPSRTLIFHCHLRFPDFRASSSPVNGSRWLIPSKHTLKVVIDIPYATRPSGSHGSGAYFRLRWAPPSTRARGEGSKRDDQDVRARTRLRTDYFEFDEENDAFIEGCVHPQPSPRSFRVKKDASTWPKV